MSNIAKGLYRSPAFVKSLLEKIGVPQRPTKVEGRKQEYYLPDIIPIPFKLELILVLCGVYYGFNRTINELVDETLKKQGFI